MRLQRMPDPLERDPKMGRDQRMPDPRKRDPTEGSKRQKTRKKTGRSESSGWQFRWPRRRRKRR